MKVKIIKLQNSDIVAMDGIELLQVNEIYDFEIVGYNIIYRDRYELKYVNGATPIGVVYPCAYAEDENHEKYLICVEERNKYSMFKNIDKTGYHKG
mgnify:CR=1 FL=1